MSERVRFTIAVDQEVYDAFADLAHTSGVSLSRCIGDWLRDTAEAAQITTLKLQEVRRSPEDAFRAFINAVAGQMPSTHAMLGESRGGRRAAGGVAARGAAAVPSPPSSNTGGKVGPHKVLKRP